MEKSLAAAKGEEVPKGLLPVKPSLNTIPNPRRKVKSVFSLNDLKQEHPLADMEKCQFKLVYANPTNFYIYLMPLDSKFFETESNMKFAITEWLKECPEKLPSPPGIAHIVLAPEGEGENLRYLRALIVKLNTNGTFACVQYCDIGLHAWVEVSSMKPISAAIMEFPRLVYMTVLAGFSVDDNNSILWSEYEPEMQKHIHEDFFIKIVSDSPDPKDLFPTSPAQVNLWYKKLTDTIDIVACITKLQKWEWIKFSGRKGQTKDKNLWRKGKYGDSPGENDWQSFLDKMLPRPILPKHLHFTATFSNAHPFTSEEGMFGATTAKSGILGEKQKDTMSQVATVMLVAVGEDRYKNYSKALEREIEKYTENIKPTEKLLDYDCLLIRIKKTQKWSRAMKVKECLYLMDLDECISYEKVKARLDIRRPYRELFKIPRMMFACHVKSTLHDDGLMRMDEASKIFKVDAEYTFRITKPETANGHAEVSLEKA